METTERRGTAIEPREIKQEGDAACASPGRTIMSRGTQLPG